MTLLGRVPRSWGSCAPDGVRVPRPRPPGHVCHKAQTTATHTRGAWATSPSPAATGRPWLNDDHLVHHEMIEEAGQGLAHSRRLAIVGWRRSWEWGGLAWGSRWEPPRRTTSRKSGPRGRGEARLFEMTRQRHPCLGSTPGPETSASLRIACSLKATGPASPMTVPLTTCGLIGPPLPQAAWASIR